MNECVDPFLEKYKRSAVNWTFECMWITKFWKEYRQFALNLSMNGNLYERIFYERIFYERIFYERVSYERIFYERVFYERIWAINGFPMNGFKLWTE